MLVGSFVNKSMILGSGGSSEWPFMVDSVWFLGDMSGLIVVFVCSINVLRLKFLICANEISLTANCQSRKASDD